jgi:riboflavin synthase
MFTGIIKNLGHIDSIEIYEGNISLWILTDIIDDIQIDQSIAHNGICLTVDALNRKLYRVTAIAETIQKTSIADWEIDQSINLELCLKLGDRLDGHIVQGHIDTIGYCEEIIEKNGSYNVRFSYAPEFAALIIEKGSIAIDGISLTCHSLSNHDFTVSIIPYTWTHTIAEHWVQGAKVNLEFDLLGKYLQRQWAISAKGE